MQMYVYSGRKAQIGQHFLLVRCLHVSFCLRPPLSLPPPCVHTLHFTDAGNIQHTPLQKYGVAGEDVHLVTMAEKMQPALLVTAHPTKKARKRKPEAEKAATK